VGIHTSIVRTAAQEFRKIDPSILQHMPIEIYKNRMCVCIYVCVCVCVCVCDCVCIMRLSLSDWHVDRIQ
jgi:hypothetical protein